MDEILLRALNGLTSNGGIRALATALSSKLMIPLVCGPLAVWLLRKRRYVAMVSIALAMGAGDLTAARVMKPAFDRERPCRAVSGLVKSARCGPGRSFPSGHATVAFAFLGSAAPVVARGWFMFTPIAVGIALSRVFLGVHYPSDVFAGAVLGSVLGLIASIVRKRKERVGEEADGD